MWGRLSLSFARSSESAEVQCWTAQVDITKEVNGPGLYPSQQVHMSTPRVLHQGRLTRHH